MAAPLPWFKVDVNVTEHPKLIGLSDAAWTLWLHGMAYAARNLTDGFIPTSVLPRLCGTKSPQKAANELVKAGAWDTWDGGWLIHDYLDHQQSAEAIEARARKKAESGSLGNHTRWHVGKGVVVADCPHCASQTDRTCDAFAIANGSQTDREPFADVEVDVEVRCESAVTASPSAIGKRRSTPSEQQVRRVLEAARAIEPKGAA